jgi:lycopene cyclase domain-containing protein
MIPDRFLYLAVDLGSFIVPFLFSFERKWIHFIGRWKAIMAGLCTMAAFFLIWDIYFTKIGVWGFNDRYITGWKLQGLPVEEYLFFGMIGFCCLFVYESMNHLIKVQLSEATCRQFFIAIASINFLVAIWYYHRAYTSVACGLNGLFILFINWKMPWFSWQRFLLGYLISFIPFTLVNGILTGSFTPEPVVWYNDSENTGLRLGTIPIEDSQYMMLMMTMSIAVYEWMRRKTISQKPSEQKQDNESAEASDLPLQNRVT